MADTTGMQSAPEHYRVMVVDDSAVIRGLLARAIEQDSQIKIVASVGDGQMAVNALQRHPVDVIILDIEMPIMDGLTAIPKLLAIDPAVKIIMASTLTLKNAEISFKAMELGAADYIPKPSSTREIHAADEFKRELIEKIRIMAALARRSGVRGTAAPAASPRSSASPAGLRPAQGGASGEPAAAVVREKTPPLKVLSPSVAPTSRPEYQGTKGDLKLRTHVIARPDIIAIGSSTGGPQALFQVIKDIGVGLSQPVVITQHMPPAFTTILAEHISKQCGVTCAEAKEGDVLEPGKYYLAPGDFHMLIAQRNGKPTVALKKDPPENFCRPAVDPMLRSLIPLYGKRVLTVILTGMGSDGTKGSEQIVEAGGSVIAQDEATSIVWGMPGAVAMAGLCSSVLPVTEIGRQVRQIAQRSSP